MSYIVSPLTQATDGLLIPNPTNFSSFSNAIQDTEDIDLDISGSGVLSARNLTWKSPVTNVSDLPVGDAENTIRLVTNPTERGIYVRTTTGRERLGSGGQNTANGITGDGSSGSPISLDIDTLSPLPSTIEGTDEIIVNRGGQEYRTTASQLLDPFDKGRFADEASLLVAYPNAIATPSDRNGWFVRLGSTDTVWVRDADSNAWLDTQTPPTVYTASEGATMVGNDIQLEIANITRTVADTATGQIEDAHEIALTEGAGGDYRATALDLKNYILEQTLTTVEPLGVINTNEAGTLSQTPTSPVRIYVGGGGAGSLVYIEGLHFTILGGVVTFNPLATGFDVEIGDVVWAEYQYLGSASTPQQYAVEPVAVTATNTLDTINNSPNSLVVLVVNGLSYIENVHFTRLGLFITWLPLVNGFDLVTTDQVYAIYYY